MAEEATEQVKSKVSRAIYETLGEDTAFNKEGGFFPNQDLSDEVTDQILALPEILIKDPDQSLPETIHPTLWVKKMEELQEKAETCATDELLKLIKGIDIQAIKLTAYNIAEQDMLKEHWVKVLPK